MKQTPELDRIQQKMKPGVLTLKGFLGTDDRKLSDIIRQDMLTVSKLELDTEEVCNKLQELADKGTDLMEQEVIVNDRYHIRVRDDRGKLPSPWGDGLFEKGDVELFDSKTQIKIKWNKLTLQLIKAHSFFGGKGSEYRINPADLPKLLD